MSASKRGKSKPSKQQSAEQLPPEGEEKKASDSQQDEVLLWYWKDLFLWNFFLKKYSKSNTVETDLDPTKDREPELTEEDEVLLWYWKDLFLWNFFLKEQPKSNNDKNRSHFIKDGESELTDEKSKGSSDFSQKSPVQEDRTGPKSVSQSNKQNNNQKCSTTTTTLIIVIGVIVAIGGIITACLISSDKSTPSTDPEWRSKVDPGSYLSDTNQNMIRASLKPILDKHPSREYESISTLLVLSKNEDIAAQLARCVLNLVNKPEKVDHIILSDKLLNNDLFSRNLLKLIFDPIQEIKLI